MRPIKANPVASRICPLDRSLQIYAPRRHPQHPTASRIKRPIPLRSPSVKNFNSLNRPSFVESRNLLSHLKRPRISSRSHHHTHRRVVRPLEIAFTHAPRNRSLERIHQVALHPHQNRLRLRIATPAIEFQHHRTASRHHQPAIEHAFDLGTLSLHALDHRTRDVMHQPVPHLVVDNVGGRVSAHS